MNKNSENLTNSPDYKKYKKVPFKQGSDNTKWKLKTIKKGQKIF